MFGASPTLVVADGFLLPGSSPGMVLAIEMEGGRARETHSLTGSTWNPLNFGSFYGTFEFQTSAQLDGMRFMSLRWCLSVVRDGCTRGE